MKYYKFNEKPTNGLVTTKPFLQIMEAGVDKFQKLMSLYENTAKLVLVVFIYKSNIM